MALQHVGEGRCKAMLAVHALRKNVFTINVQTANNLLFTVPWLFVLSFCQ